MQKEIGINGKKCLFKATAAIPRLYRIQFKRDIFKDLSKMQKDYERTANAGADEIPVDSIEIFENIAYLMHKHGDPGQPDNIDDWLAQFEMFDIYQVLPQVLSLWGDNIQTASKPQKKRDS